MAWSGNKLIVVWQDEQSHLLAQAISHAGEILWDSGGVKIRSHPKEQGLPEVLPAGEGGALFIWWSDRCGESNCYMQRLDANGKPMWETNGIPLFEADQLTHFNRSSGRSFVSDGMGGFYLVWTDSMDNNCRVVLHRFDLNGKPLWKSPTVVSSVTYSRIASTFASDGHGGLILVWQPYENFTHDNIYAQRIDATGKTLWGDNGITVCDALSKEDEIAIVGDGNGGVVVAWKDDRDIFPDIYAQRIGADGNMVPHLLVVAGEAGDVNIVFSDQADIYLYRIR